MGTVQATGTAQEEIERPETPQRRGSAAGRPLGAQGFGGAHAARGVEVFGGESALKAALSFPKSCNPHYCDV